MPDTYKLSLFLANEKIDVCSTLFEEVLSATAISTSKSEEQPEKWKLEAYFVDMPSKDALVEVLNNIDEPAYVNDASSLIEVLPEQDWVSKVQQDLSPVKAGWFTIFGHHDRDKFIGCPYAIEIDAGQAFGTAHHGTTKGCLLAIQIASKSRRHNKILDLGTGTGILAIAAQKLNKSAQIIASDIDKISTKVAKDNCRINKAGPAIEVIHATGVHHNRLKQRFDFIIANILAEPLIKLAPAFSQRIHPRGNIILSGLLASQAREVIANYINNDFVLTHKIIIDEWATLIMTKRNSRCFKHIC